jgi:hypothetical protein
MLEKGDNYNLADGAATMAIAFSKGHVPGEVWLLMALARKAEGKLDKAQEPWRLAKKWRREHGPIEDRGLKALFDDADKRFAVRDTTPRITPTETQR